MANFSAAVQRDLLDGKAHRRGSEECASLGFKVRSFGVWGIYEFKSLGVYRSLGVALGAKEFKSLGVQESRVSG